LLLPHALPLLRQARPDAPVSVAPDAGQAWRQAVAASIRGRQVHGNKGLRSVFEAFLALPTAPGGWALQQAACKIEGGPWQCQVDYARRDAWASNSSFLNAAPPSWEVDFTSLDQASARWQLESHGVLVSRLKLPSPAQAERDLLSALQGVKPGFVFMQTGRAVPVPVVAPKDEQGRAMPRPAGQA